MLSRNTKTCFDREGNCENGRSAGYSGVSVARLFRWRSEQTILLVVVVGYAAQKAADSGNESNCYPLSSRFA